MLPPKPQRDYCRVEFPYAPQNDDELELKVDDIITVITTELPDKGWWKGELRGKVGVFPDNFVKMMAPSEGELFRFLSGFSGAPKAFSLMSHFEFGLSSGCHHCLHLSLMHPIAATTHPLSPLITPLINWRQFSETHRL